MLNPDTGKFEPVIGEDNDLRTDDGQAVASHCDVFAIGQTVHIDRYRYRIISIGPDRMVLTPLKQARCTPAPDGQAPHIAAAIATVLDAFDRRQR